MAGGVAGHVRPIQAGETLEKCRAGAGGSGRFTGDPGKEVSKKEEVLRGSWGRCVRAGS